MLSQNEIVNGGNLAWTAAMLLTFIASIWLYFKGEWRHSGMNGLRKSSQIFLIGTAITHLSMALHRMYWTGYLIMLEKGDRVTLADYSDWRWLTPVLAITGTAGCLMMLYPMAKFLSPLWHAVITAAFVGFIAIGVIIT